MDFFVPGTDTPEAAETFYRELAKLCHLVTVEDEPARRIYSITYETDRHTTWTATVGQRLRGTRTEMRTVRGKRVERDVPVHGDATILAIYAGTSYQVVLEAPPGTTSASQWHNPINAGEPERVELFAG